MIHFVPLVRLVDVEVGRAVRAVLPSAPRSLNPTAGRPDIRRILRSIEDQVADSICSPPRHTHADYAANDGSYSWKDHGPNFGSNCATFQHKWVGAARIDVPQRVATDICVDCSPRHDFVVPAAISSDASTACAHHAGHQPLRYSFLRRGAFCLARSRVALGFLAGFGS